MKRTILYEKMRCGDYLKIILHDKPPINDCDDIEIDIKSQYGRNKLFIQDWEAMLFVKGLLDVVRVKHNGMKNFLQQMLKEKKFTLVAKPTKKQNVPSNQTR
jgi:hypothetical protein